MALGKGQGYMSLHNDKQEYDDDSGAAGSSAWTGLARTFSDQTTAVDEFELNSINERTGHKRPSPASRLDSSGQDIISEHPGSSPNPRPLGRRRGFHNNPTLMTGDSSRQAKSSLAPSSRFASVKQALGRASTRVMGTPSHHQPQPPVPDIPSIFQQHAQEEEQEARASDDDGNTATVGQPAEDESTGSRTPLALQPETVYNQQERIDPPLEGISLFIFGPENPLRKKLNRFLNQP